MKFIHNFDLRTGRARLSKKFMRRFKKVRKISVKTLDFIHFYNYTSLWTEKKIR